MKLHPRVTRSMLELVKRFEGLRRQAARLPDGGWTVGYGHTRSARDGAVVSAEDAEALLHYDLSEVAEKVEAWTFTPLNQNQFEALTAFTFNIGLENFRHSTVLKRVNEGQHLMAAAALELWRKSDFGGEDLVVDALVRRRAAEKAHYLTPPEGFRPSPTPVLRPAFDHSVIETASQSLAGRSTVIVDAPLEGDKATATVEAPFAARDNDQAAFPYMAAAAAGVGARLHQLFPDRTGEQDVEDRAPPPPPEPARIKAANDGLLGREAAPENAGPHLEAPPPPKIETGLDDGGFSGFAPPPVRQIAPSRGLSGPGDRTVAGPTALRAHTAVGHGAPLFDAPSFRSRFASPEPAVVRSRDDAAAIVEAHKPGPLHDRSMVYFCVGLVGVALLAAALFSIFSGKASPVNLVVGLMGILLMTPSGAHFLMRVLTPREDRVGA